MVTRMSFRTTFLLFVKFSYCPLSLSFINSLHYNTKKAKLKSRGRWKGYFPLRPWIPSRTKHVVRQRREGWTSREVLGRRIGSKSLLLWRHNGRPPSVRAESENDEFGTVVTEVTTVITTTRKKYRAGDA